MEKVSISLLVDFNAVSVLESFRQEKFIFNNSQIPLSGFFRGKGFWGLGSFDSCSFSVMNLCM